MVETEQSDKGAGSFSLPRIEPDRSLWKSYSECVKLKQWNIVHQIITSDIQKLRINAYNRAIIKRQLINENGKGYILLSDHEKGGKV